MALCLRVAMTSFAVQGVCSPKSRQQQTYRKPGTSTWPGFFVVLPGRLAFPDHDQPENGYDRN
jgi:hypothetical protein